MVYIFFEEALMLIVLNSAASKLSAQYMLHDKFGFLCVMLLNLGNR